MKKFAFFYFMKERPDEIRATVPAHVEYLEKSGVSNFSGGPFADRSGGLILFDTSDESEALALTEQDPFVLNDLLEQKWLKEWLVQG